MRKWMAAALATYVFFLHHWQVSWYTPATFWDVWVIVFMMLPLFYVLGPMVSTVSEAIMAKGEKTDERWLFSLQLALIMVIIGLLSGEAISYYCGMVYVVAYRIIPWIQGVFQTWSQRLFVYTPLICFILSLFAFWAGN